MQKPRLVLCLILLVILQACSNPIKDEIGDPAYTRSVTAITIINRTSNRLIKDKLEITDKDKIRDIIRELKKMEEINLDNVRANTGFFEVDITTGNKKTYKVDVVYTVYNGVVISDMSNRYYKNDNLENLILNYFQ